MCPLLWDVLSFPGSLEYLPEGDLQSYIGAGRLSEKEAQSITKQLLEGLKAMHDSGFAHRDVKPKNILIQWP